MRYLVKRAWVGVKVGDIIETESIHPALLDHVEPVKEERSLEVATPRRGSKRKEEPQGDTE